jgi:hypothetical protein
MREWRHEPVERFSTRLRPQSHRQSRAESLRRASRPNILLLMTNQHRADCIGAGGNDAIRTPNLESRRQAGGSATRIYRRPSALPREPRRSSVFRAGITGCSV